MSIYPTESQSATHSQAQTDMLEPAMNLQIPTDFFWTMLEGGYVGVVECQHPTYQHSQLTVQQFIEPDSYGIAFYQPDTLTILEASVITREQMIEQLQNMEIQSGWSFYPSTMEDPSMIDEAILLDEVAHD